MPSPAESPARKTNVINKLELTKELYNKCIAFAKKTIKGVWYYEDVIHDLIIEKGNIINEDNFRPLILKAIHNFNVNDGTVYISQIGHYGKKVLTGLCCKKCGENLPESEFRVTINKKSKKDENRATCRLCEIKIRLNLYHNKQKLIPSWLNTLYEKQKKYRILNREKINSYKKKVYYENIEKSRERNKEYRQRAKKRGKKDTTAKERAARYRKIQKEELGDWYIKRLLTRHKKIEVTQEMIEVKRQEILKMRKDGNWRTLRKSPPTEKKVA